MNRKKLAILAIAAIAVFYFKIQDSMYYEIGILILILGILLFNGVRGIVNSELGALEGRDARALGILLVVMAFAVLYLYFKDPSFIKDLVLRL